MMTHLDIRQVVLSTGQSWRPFQGSESILKRSSDGAVDNFDICGRFSSRFVVVV